MNFGGFTTFILYSDLMSNNKELMFFIEENRYFWLIKIDHLEEKEIE